MPWSMLRQAWKSRRGGGGDSVTFCFPSSKLLGQFSRHGVGVSIVHHQPLWQAKKKGLRIQRGGGFEHSSPPPPPLHTHLVIGLFTIFIIMNEQHNHCYHFSFYTSDYIAVNLITLVPFSAAMYARLDGGLLPIWTADKIPRWGPNTGNFDNNITFHTDEIQTHYKSQ